MRSEHEIRLLHRDLCGSDVGTFRFSRPEAYDYAAGQWMRITLDTAEGPDARTFSHASAPADDYLEMATRRSGSAFKEALWELDESATVAVSGPGGRLALPPHARTAVFLAGGVGITPVRSILRDAQQRGQEFDDIVVFYGNRDPECMPYLDELGAMGSIGVRVVPVYERDAPPGAAAGLISPELVERYVD
ncbi:MAG: FAD-dependent oxidoreductase, partial [Coriobacteriales bacterium]|nr:FAD-dependent oxidoreductase [Coriobacteriales bacterium]